MGKSKKTFDVETFKQYVNSQLERTDEFANESFKSGLCVALEETLHKTGNYKGFNHLYWNETGFKDWVNAGQPEDWETKKVFILGDKSSKYRGNEYARRYY